MLSWQPVDGSKPEYKGDATVPKTSRCAILFAMAVKSGNADLGHDCFSQYGMLQEQFSILWEARSNTTEAPRLRASGRWMVSLLYSEPARVSRSI